MATVKVKFLSDYKDRRYFYTAPDGDWKAGDLAVVDSPSSGFTLTEVVEVDAQTYEGNKPVVGMVSLDSYNQSKANFARRKEILAQLERAAAAKAETERFTHLRNDPAMAGLLEELENLK